MFGDWESIAALVAAILIAYGVILWLGAIVWTYRDIRERTRDGWSQTISVALVVLFNIPGLIIYMLLRPRESLSEAYERRLEAEVIMRELPEMRACPTCQRQMDDEFLLCPYCRTRLRQACTSCGRTLELIWATCPYCGAQGPQPQAAPARPFNAEQTTARAPAGDRAGARGAARFAEQDASSDAGATPATTPPSP